MSSLAKLMWALLLAGLCTSGYLSYRHYHAQAQLGLVLQQLDITLTTQNNDAAIAARSTLQGIKGVVAKNRNHPAELMMVHRAEALGSHIQALCDTLHGYRARLRRTAANSALPDLLRQPKEIAAVARLLGNDTQTQRAFHQQLAACADTLRRLGPATPVRLTAPSFNQLPLTEALAALALLEAQVLASEARTLRNLAQSLGASHIPIRFVAAATAESSIVAAGGTYRARLLLVKSLSPGSLRMYCNGRPVPVGPDGIGYVHFRAPHQPGPVDWVGAVRFSQNGRDTTFTVRVPYRVTSR